MQEDIHPEYHPVVFVDGEHEIVTRSTVTSESTREIDGVEHYVVHVDVSAFTHPFYTGQQKLVDTEGRVDRFLKRYDLDREEQEIGQAPSDEEQQDAEAADDQSASAETEEPEADEGSDQETDDNDQ